ncbi:MAG: hypothetical protein ACLFWG_10140 [Longimicrobiales bacterium]
MTLVILTEGDTMFDDEKATGSADPTRDAPPELPGEPEHVSDPSDAELERRFSYSKPDEARAERHRMVDSQFIVVAKWVRDVTPPGRAQALALTALEEARMRANQAIAIG